MGKALYHERKLETIQEWLMQVGNIRTKNNNKKKFNIKNRKIGQETICVPQIWQSIDIINIVRFSSVDEKKRNKRIEN